MPELNELNTIPDLEITDDDFLLIYDVGSGSSLKVSKASLLAGLAADGGDHDFGTSTINDLTAPLLETNDLSFTLGGNSLKVAIAWSGNVAVDAVSSASVKPLTATITGALTTDHVILTVAQAVPEVLSFRGRISATDTLTIEAVNPTGGSINPGTVSFRALVIRTA